MRKLLLVVVVVVVVVVGLVGGTGAKAEWVDVGHVINGNTFETVDGEVINIIGLPRTPATQMTTFFLEGNDVWVDRKTIDNSDRTFAVVDLHGNVSYSQIVDGHKYEKSSDSIICLSSNKKYVCNNYKPHCKSPNPYSTTGARRIRHGAKTHRKTRKDSYGTPVESFTMTGVGNSGGYGAPRGSGRGQSREISRLQSKLKALDRKIADANSGIDFRSKMHSSSRGLRHDSKGLSKQRIAVQEQIHDLQMIDAGANPSWVMDRRRDTRDVRIQGECDNVRIQGEKMNGGFDSEGNHYSSAGGGNAIRDSDGTFMQKTGGGYIDTSTGEFVPVN